MNGSTRARTVLIGLDGATFTVLSPLLENGTMPFLATFAESGAHGCLESTPHPLTPPAWTSLMTGRTPGNHGIFDFVSVDLLTEPERALLWRFGASRENFTLDEVDAVLADSGIADADASQTVKRLITKGLIQDEVLDGKARYFATGSASLPVYTLATSSHVRSETLWSLVSRHGGRATVLNFPCTFPPPEINGFVVSGYVPWSALALAVHPDALYPRLKSRPGFDPRQLAIEWDFERKAVQGLPEEELERWVEFHTCRERQWFDIARWLMQEEPCELTAVLFDGVDRLQHLCFHLLDPSLASREISPRAQYIRHLCLDYFRQLDSFIKEIVELAGASARVFIASDHGFSAAGDQIFYANTWLEQQGYLTWADGVPVDERGRVALDEHTESSTLLDWSKTTAFALTSSSNGIYIRRAEFPGAPGVLPDEYDAFRERLVASLLSVTDPRTGVPLVERVLLREEAFRGKHMDKAPDLTLVLRDRSFLSILRADQPLKPRRMPYGTHHPHGVLFARGPGIRSGTELSLSSIVDVGPTLLYSLGLAVPETMEGAPILAAFEPSFVAAHPVSTDRTDAGGTVAVRVRDVALDAESEARVRRMQRLLGY